MHLLHGGRAVTLGNPGEGERERESQVRKDGGKGREGKRGRGGGRKEGRGNFCSSKFWNLTEAKVNYCPFALSLPPEVTTHDVLM